MPMPPPINYKECGIDFFLFFTHIYIIYKLLANASLALYLCTCISESIIITTLVSRVFSSGFVTYSLSFDAVHQQSKLSFERRGMILNFCESFNVPIIKYICSYI